MKPFRRAREVSIRQFGELGRDAGVAQWRQHEFCKLAFKHRGFESHRWLKNPTESRLVPTLFTLRPLAHDYVRLYALVDHFRV